MKRKLALKRLSASDLTLFEHQYRNTSGAKQKAINLDAAIFVNQFFSSLPSEIDINRDDVKVTLAIYGPGEAVVHNVTRKILKEAKNWRLNGELVSNPPEEPGRYDPLGKGDFAIMEFIGNTVPHTVRVYLVARTLPKDAALHSSLMAEYGSMFSPRKGMEVISPESLARLLNSLHLPEGHPLLDFIDLDSLEDAAQGGVEGLRKLRKQRQTRGVSHEELDSAKRAAEKVGKLGEELLNDWLESQKAAGNIEDFRWESRINAIAPYDFALLESNADARRLDAKSTGGDFRNPIHISMAELLEMSEGGLPYDLYRLYLVNQTSARLRIAKNLRETALTIVESFKHLPSGVSVDGISLNPNILDFGEEITIAASSSDEDSGT